MKKINKSPLYDFIPVEELSFDFDLDFEQFRIDLRNALKEYIVYYDN